MTSLSDLIERLEKATGADRELDRDILFEIFPKDRVAIFDGVKHISTMTAANGEPWFIALAERDDCPEYTASMEEALTLAPERWSWRCGNLPSGRGFADLGTQESLQCIEGATPAIALCIACLKARMKLAG